MGAIKAPRAAVGNGRRVALAQRPRSPQGGFRTPLGGFSLRQGDESRAKGVHPPKKDTPCT
jgi:hypothetical protein